MATYNVPITTNAGDEKSLDYVVAKVNADRAAKKPPRPPITKIQLITNLVNDNMKSYRQQYLQDVRGRIGVAIGAATPAQVTAAAAALGITEP